MGQCLARRGKRQLPADSLPQDIVQTICQYRGFRNSRPLPCYRHRVLKSAFPLPTEAFRGTNGVWISSCARLRINQRKWFLVNSYGEVYLFEGYGWRQLNEAPPD